MSATGRSEARESHKFDYYVTPLHTAKEFIREWNKDTAIISRLRKSGGVIVDPCAGGGEGNVPTYTHILNHLKLNPTSIDIRSDSKADVIGSYMDVGSRYKADLIIGNPPFNLAMEFIIEGLNNLVEGGHLVYLLRLNYFGSQKRKSFWRETMPIRTYVHSRRPCFTKSGSDSAEYAHFVWQKGEYPRVTTLRVI